MLSELRGNGSGRADRGLPPLIADGCTAKPQRDAIQTAGA